MYANQHQITSTIDMETHALCGLSIEVLDQMQKREVGGLLWFIAGDYDPTLNHTQKREIEEALWFIAEYCTAKGWAMGDIAKRKLEKLFDKE